jgi:hypothetical protein
VLRSLLDRIGESFPDDPHLAPAAMKKLKVVRCSMPPCVYVRIDSDPDLPQDSDLLLWAGIGLWSREIQVGSPDDAVWRSSEIEEPLAKRLPRKWARNFSVEPNPIPFAIKMRSSEQCPDATRRKLLEILEDAGRAYTEALRHPAYDIPAVIAALKALSEDRGKPHPAYERPPDDSCYTAFLVLRSESEAKRLTEAQRQAVIPILIGLLTDTRVIADRSACDGPVISATHMAYELLRLLTGRDFANAIEGGPSCPNGRLHEPPPKVDNSAEKVRARLKVWQDWWDEEQKQVQPVPVPRDEKTTPAGQRDP